MADLLHNNPHIQGIQGIQIGDYINLLSQFADDTDLFLTFTKENLIEVTNTLNVVERNTGLKVNYDKNSIYCIGFLVYINSKFYTQKQSRWTNKTINILGVNVCNDIDSLEELNYPQVVSKMQNITQLWQKRTLTLQGKVLVINTLISSLAVYKMTVVPCIKHPIVNQFESIIYKYLWKGPTKILMEALKNPIEFGGLRLVDFQAWDFVLKINWIFNPFNTVGSSVLP